MMLLRRLYYLFLGFFFLFAKTGSASHMQGAEINYTYLGNNQYHVAVKFYRDCRGIPFNNPDIGYYAGSGGSSSCGGSLLTNFKRTSITDITPLCATQGKPCNPQNTGGTGEGIELHVYEDILDFSKAPFASLLSNNACEDIVFYAGQCCRNGAITTGSAGNDFWVTATLKVGNLRKCVNKQNSSVKFGSFWLSSGCCNQPKYESLGANDSMDYDSLSFALAPAYSSKLKQSVGYTSPFTYEYPVTPYCIPPSNIKCTPNLITDPPRGFYLNTVTGEMVFTPTKCDEVAVVVVEVTEWRRDTTGKMVAISIVRRDNQIIIKDDCGYNKGPKISGKWRMVAAAGDSICQTFKIEDVPFTPFQTAQDSISVSWQGESAKPTWTLTRDSNNGKASLLFCWKPNNNIKTGRPYLFTIEASDNHCPKPAVINRTFEVYIGNLDTAQIEVSQNTSCNSARLSVKLNKGNINKGSYIWLIKDSITGKTVFQGGGSQTISNSLTQGTYQVILQAYNDYFYYAPQTTYIQITGSAPRVSLGNDTAACQGVKYSFHAKTENMKAPITYSWYVNGVFDKLNKKENIDFIKTAGSAKITVIVVDSNNCQVQDTVGLSNRILPHVSWSNTLPSSLCWNEPMLGLNAFIEEPKIENQKQNRTWVEGVLSKKLIDSTTNGFYLNQRKLNNDLDLANGKIATETLILKYKDSFGCQNTDTAKVDIKGSPIVQVKEGNICLQNKSTALINQVLKPTSKSQLRQNWKLLTWPSKVDTTGMLQDKSNGKGTDWRFYFQDNDTLFYGGKYNLEYSVYDSTNGCSEKANCDIHILPELEPTNQVYCITNQDYELNTIFTVSGLAPSNGTDTYTIYSKDGDTAKSKWGNAFIN
ncbi:MAG: hypothetical protein IT244_13735, partial [Bacteroidia bacterium]|nr:hypothetical protein [Bacteroidia bacterium]